MRKPFSGTKKVLQDPWQQSNTHAPLDKAASSWSLNVLISRQPASADHPHSYVPSVIYIQNIHTYVSCGTRSVWLGIDMITDMGNSAGRVVV